MIALSTVQYNHVVRIQLEYGKIKTRKKFQYWYFSRGVLAHLFPMHPFSTPWGVQKECIGNKWVKSVFGDKAASLWCTTSYRILFIVLLMKCNQKNYIKVSYWSVIKVYHWTSQLNLEHDTITVQKFTQWILFFTIMKLIQYENYTELFFS